LAGCSSTPKEEKPPGVLETVRTVLIRGTGEVREVVRNEVVVVKVPEVKIVAPPEELVKNCVVGPPPGRADYLASDPEKKQELLSFYIKDTLKTISICNNTINSIRSWIKTQTNTEANLGK
jgi:hypothetical protein